MNSNSNAAATSGTFFIAPCMHHQRVGLPGLLLRLLEALGVALAVSLNLSGSTGITSAPISYRPSGSRKRSRRCARRDAVVVAALRADVQVLLEIGRVEHRLARRALAPQALRHWRFAGRSVRLIFGGSSFWSQLMRAPSLAATHRARARMPGRANAASHVRRPRRRGRGLLHLLDDAAADDDRIGDRADRARASRRRGCRSRRRPASGVLRRMRGERSRHVGDVEVRRAGHALQRDVVDVAAAPAAPPGRCAPRSRSARAGRSRSMPCARHQRRERPAFLRRVVDDEHAVDAGVARARRRSARTPMASIGLA